MVKGLLLSLLQTGVCKLEGLLGLDFPEAVEIELADEAFKLGLSEVKWKNLTLHS